MCVAAGAFMMSTGFLSWAQSEYRDVDTQQKVYDYADLLTQSQEDALRETCESIIADNNYDVFLLTIDDNNIDYSSQDRTLSFIEDFGDENGFGIGEDYNYVAFIIDMDERNYNIDVKGERCLKIFSTEIQEGIKDDVQSYMVNGEYDRTLRSFLAEVERCGSTETATFVGSEEEWQSYQRNELIRAIAGRVFGSLIVALIVGGLAVLFASARHKTVHKAVDAQIYQDETSFQITKSKDDLVRNYTTTRTIHTSSGSGSSGGSSGGSHHTSTHRSSGGSTHGGGSSRGF